MESDSQQSLNARLKSIGIKEAYASHLVTGRRTPSLALALEIQSKLGIPVSDWAERKKRAQEAATPAKPRASGCPA